MNYFPRIIKALNQSFKLIFVAFGNGIKAVFRFVKKVAHLLSDGVKLLHKYIAIVIQVIINVSSAAFILFIPVIFFFDPLNWSRHIGNYISNKALFVMRISLGVFFSLVAFFLIKELYKVWKESDEEKEEKKQSDFIGFISKLLAWLVILGLLLYFTIFRYQFIPVEIYFHYLPFWAQELLINLYPK